MDLLILVIKNQSSTPWKYFKRTKCSFWSEQLRSMKFSTQAHHGWTFSFVLSKNNLKFLESTFKSYFQPHESTSKSLNRASWNKLKDNIELLWDQLTCLNPFWWLPIIIFNPSEYFQSLSSTPWKYFQRCKCSFGSHQFSSMKFSTQARHGLTFTFMLSKQILNPLRILPKPKFNPMKVLPKV